MIQSDAMGASFQIPRAFPPCVVGSVSDEQMLRFVVAPEAELPCDMVEFRVDMLPVESAVSGALRAPCSKPVLLTVRHACEGGGRAMPEGERRDLAFSLLPVVSALDWEAAFLAESRDLVDAAHALAVPVIASAHYFDGVPPLLKLLDVQEKARSLGADVVKFAFRLFSVEDMAVGVELLRRATGPIAVMGMGSLAPVSRLLYSQMGSCLMYGYLGAGATAPGQWPVELCQRAVAALNPVEG